MATQYNRNEKSISVVAYDPFDPLTGDAGNIDTIVSTIGNNFRFAGGDLFVAGRAVAALDQIGKDIDTEETIALTPSELAAGWTED